jgi:ribosome recycling factor
MDAKAILADCKDKMDKRVQAYEKELTRVRTGRASVNMLDGVKVNYYGSITPLNQVSTVTTPDARSIVVAPFEKSLIAEIEKSILKADLGLNPTSDGHVVRIPIPPLNEDRRRDIAKGLKKNAEEAKVAIRHIRRDVNENLKKVEKSKEISEDDRKKLEADVQKMTDNYIKVIDDKTAMKEKEVMTV